MNELLNNAPCGFLVFADNGTIIEANATLQEMLGFEVFKGITERHNFAFDFLSGLFQFSKKSFL